MSYSRSSASYQYAYQRTDGFSVESVKFSGVSSSSMAAQNVSQSSSAYAFSEGNYAIDGSRSDSGRAAETASVMSAVSRSRRLQFYPNESNISNETMMSVTKNGDLLLGDRQKSKMGNALFKVLSSEDESEKEIVTEEERRVHLQESDFEPAEHQLQITECVGDSHGEKQDLPLKEENGDNQDEYEVRSSSLSNILQDTNIKDTSLQTVKESASYEVSNSSGEESLTTRTISKRKSLDEMDDRSDDDENLIVLPTSRSDSDSSALDPVEQLASSMRAAGYTQALRSRDIIEQYVVTTDYTPDDSGVGSIALREGQTVEVLDATSKYRWLVRTRPSKYLSPRQGWIPASYLEKKTADMTLGRLNSYSESESDTQVESLDRDAALKRRDVVKELVDTEDEFVRDMQHVVNTYLREMDNPRMPKELRDQKEALFLNFKEICDFHDNIFIKGVQYYAGEPCKLGRAFLRMERDFDMHAKYCEDEPKAQEVLSAVPVKEYFEEYSNRIGEIDRSLKDHLKLPIQRINDYQLLLKEIIKYTAQLKEDCSDLQKALDLLLSIPQRAHDLKYINAIEGCRGNLQKFGRLLKHDWFTITDSTGRIKERYLFLFTSRIFVTNVRKVGEGRPHFILKDIIKLNDVEIKDTGEEKRFEIHKKVEDVASKYPLILEAQTSTVKDNWLKELNCVSTERLARTALLTSANKEVAQENTKESFKEIKVDKKPKPEVESINICEVDESSKVITVEENTKPTLIEEFSETEDTVNFEDAERLNTVMTDNIQSRSVSSTDANAHEESGSKPFFSKPLKGISCLRGDTATLECELRAVPPAIVTWLKDNVPLTQSENVQFVTKGNVNNLVIKNTKHEDSGLYLCKATNSYGTASCSTQLNVQDVDDSPQSTDSKAPEFVIKFKDTELLEGTSVRFLIKVRAQPEATIEFLKNDRPLKEDDRIKFITEDQNTFELSIHNFTLKDAGKYTCVAKNDVGKSSFTAEVKVTSEKHLFPGICEVPIMNGGLLKKGEQPEFKWFRGGQEIESSERFKVLLKDEEDTLALVFQHVKPEDAGLYTCVASTRSGRISCSAELSVEGAVKQLMKDPEAPKILANLTDTEVSEGASAMLDLKVSGYPKPKLTWLKDGVEIKAGGRFKFLHEDDESMALIIKGITYEDAGKYTVKVKNDLGEVTTNGHLLVKVPPKIKTEMKDTAVMTDSTVKFDVEVEGQPTPEVMWYKDGHAVKENDRIKITKKKDMASLEIKKAVIEDSGSYSCIATNTSGKTSEFAMLTVNDPPKFLKEIKNIECKESETIKFEAKITGNPEPTIKWLFNDEEIKSDGTHIKIEKDDRHHSLTINNATKKDVGKYSLSAVNIIGSSVSSGNLTVNYPPSFRKQLSNMTVKEGETDVKFDVSVSGWPSPKIRWFIDSMEISETSKKYKVVNEGETSALIIKNVESDSSGCYSCTISNDYGEVSSKGVLNVLTKPTFTKKMQDITVVEEEDVTFNVTASGNPSPTLKWVKDNSEVNVTANIKISKTEDGSCSLNIRAVSEESAGLYECHATNTEGEAVTISRLVVHTHPRFDCELKDVEVWNGMDAVIEAVGTSIPSPEVKWFKNGEPIEIDKRITFEDDGKYHRLIIQKTVPEDSGKFKISLKNHLGEASQEGQLTVKASTEALVPIVLKKLDDVVCIMGNHANFEAKIYANPDPEVHWYKNGEELQASDHIVISKNDIKHTHDLTIKSASPADVGVYSVVARNVHGEISSEASLEVQEPPVIQEIKDKKTMPDSSVCFETKVTGKPKPVVKWLKGDREIKENDRIKFEYQEESGVYKLCLSKVTPEDGGQYACVAENVAAVTKAPFNLSVTTEAPHFIKGLHDSSCKLNHGVHLDVQVYGLPMPAVKWFKDGVELEEGLKFKMTQSDERNFSLTIDKFCKDDSGKYTCKAFNQAGEAVTHGSLSLKHALPEFLKQLPKEVCVIDGEPFVLEAKLDNNPMPEVKWVKDGKEIQPDDHIKIEELPDGTVRLSVENGVPEDRGKYTLVAANEAGQETSSGHVIVEAMPKAPSFLKTLKDADVPRGSGLILSAKVTAHPRPAAKWLKDGKPVKLDGRIKLSEEPGGCFSLEIDDVKPEDEGKYTLLVSNHRGEASSTSNVAVKSPSTAPVILQHLKSSNVVTGAPCHFEAKIEGDPLSSVKWFKDGVPFTPDNNRVKAVSRPDGTVALLFDKTEPQDAGKYTLEVSNPHGSVTSDGNLCLIEKDKIGEKASAPKFVVPLRDIIVDEGKPIKLLTQIEGNPFPEVQWKKDGEPIKMTDSLFLTSDGDKIGLEIKKGTLKDAGKYECQLSNPEGVSSGKADVGVNQIFKPPVFSQKISDQFSITGGDPRFVCKVHGFPKPDITWYFKDVPIEHDNTKYKIKRDGDICVLQIKGATTGDRGSYSCKATNDVGTATCTANLEISDIGEKKERAEPPSFLKKLGDCSVMEGIPAKFTACVAGFPEPTFKWYKDGQELSASGHIQFQVEPHGLLRLIIKDATPQDAGTYVLKISNPHGEAETAAQLIFDMYEDKKPRDRRSDPSADKDKKSRRPVIDDNKGNKPILDPAEEWNTDHDKRAFTNDVDKDEKPQIKGPQVNGDINAQKPFTLDDHDHKPKDRMADLNIDHDKFRRSAIPLALPDKPIISKMSDRRLTLSWKPSLPVGPSVPVTYIVDMCEVPNGDWFVARSGIRGCCCEIRNLEPFQDYKFRVRVENKYGVSDPSPFAITYRQKLEMTPPKQLPRLPPEFDFRPETSQYFPKDYDIDRPPHEEYAHAPRFLRQSDDTQYAVKGEPASIEWWVYGYPTPTVSFAFKEESIPMGGHYESIIARNGQCKLYLSRMMDKDVGIYECSAVNEHGEARQRLNLAIAEHPVFILHLEEENIMLRKGGVLQCRVVGVPYPEIKWYKDWHPIVSSNRIKIEWKEPDLCTLTISDSINKDAGLYSCCARNIAGMATTSAMVNIEENEDDYAALKYDHSRIVRAHTKPMENQYDIGDELGRGTQGIVYHAVERSTGNSYAAKSMYAKGDAKNLMLHELDIMNQLHDRHIIRARDAFETKNSLILVSDLAAGGELLDNICKQPNISESEIAHYIRQILWGLEHMHNKGIAHLGLTPGDILLSKPGGDDIKICDFGLANRIIKGKDLYLDYGMPEFVAPEVVQHRPVTFATDMWSVGVISYLLLSGISPFLGSNDRETLKRIQKGQLAFDPQVFTDVSDEAKDFIAKLLVFDADGRLNVKAALSHPWLKFADRLGTGNILDTSRLKDYFNRYKEWVRNSACNRFYRRRPLSSANDHPSGMIYPRGERFTPLSSPEPSPTLKTTPDWSAPTFTDKVQMEHDDMNYDLGYADSTSRYQCGPDTYLLQLRDVGFPLRLREYMRVSASRSPTLALKLQDTISGQAVTVRERRRFMDVMDEEIDDEKRGQLDGVRRRFRSEVSPRSDTKHRLKELLPGLREQEQAPYFREKLHDTAFSEDDVIELSCLVIGEPKPVITWYRNDVLMSESYRVKITEDSNGKHCIRFNPIKPFDGGIYKAVARNIAGEVVCRARLKQGEKPGRPDAPTVPQISDTEALITWYPPKSTGISPVTCFSLEFKEMDDTSWTEVASNISHHFMIVKNLKPNSQYHFRVKACNRFGWGDLSNSSQTIKTEESGAPKISISKAMKYQQELTESGKSISETSLQPVLDYSIEKAPIEISTNVPTEKYNFISEISRGRFSVVVKCCQRDGSEVFAAKLLECTPSSEASILNEYNNYKSLRHERIPCLYEVYRYNNLFVFIEEKLQGVDILTYLTRNSTYSEAIVTRVVTQVLDALEYLHFRNIIHLDVQPDNVVVSNLSTADVKLIDFGNSRVASQDGQKPDKRGNPEFTAPEVFSAEELTTHADIWSVGVLAYVLLSGVSPFRGETAQETTQNVTYVRYRFEHLYKEITQEATRFLMAVFKKTPQKRPTAEECLEHKWLNPSELLLKKRERAIFLSNKLKQFADDYHKQRQNVATSSERLLGAFGMKLSRSISVDYDTMTTF